ncbi:hypothetical protein COCOBI_01-5800 [Coccomyxa sp. Obi]|nr:hypothetical protein COCOBI_01-5800 [Coccomyxa sp. Obi]
MDATPAGKISVARSTPFKRMRSPTGRLSYDPMCTPTFDGFDDAALDNVRSQKRYLSEAMATDLSRLNMAFGDDAGTRRPSSPSVSSMQTDKDSYSGNCCSPTLSECFNPFDSPRVLSRDQLEVPGAGSYRRASNSPSKSGVHPSTSPVKPHLFALGSGHGPPASPMQGTPGRKVGHFSRRGAALDAGERLPPSPSDPQLGMDLRKTALLRSLLLRTEEKVRATPMRRRSRMSDIMHRSAPEPFSRGGGLRSLSELSSPDGSADMDLGGSVSSEDEDDHQGIRPGSGKLGAIFSLSDTEDLSLRERASLILGEASREVNRQHDDTLDPDSVLQPVSFEKGIRHRTSG